MKEMPLFHVLCACARALDLVDPRDYAIWDSGNVGNPVVSIWWRGRERDKSVDCCERSLKTVLRHVAAATYTCGGRCHHRRVGGR